MKLYRVVAFLLLLWPAVIAGAQERTDRMALAPAYPVETLRQIIVPRDAWKPFPNYADPSGLDNIPVATRNAYIKEAEGLLGTRWEPIPATAFLEYSRSASRAAYEKLTFPRRQNLAVLVLAELFERKGRFLDAVVDGIWAISEESFWGVSAHVGGRQAAPGPLPDVSEPTVDLFAAETGALLAFTDYLLGPALDEVHPLIRKRIAYEVDRRLFTPYLERDFGYMGFGWRKATAEGRYERPVNNWNPWVNSNILFAALVLEDDADRRVQLIYRVMDSLDNFVLPYPADGGCDEGPSYWGRAGASLFETLDWLHMASNGKIDVYDKPLVREMGRYIYKVYIADDFFIDFADASARMHPEVGIVYRYGKAIEDETMQGFAAYVADAVGYGDGVIPSSFGWLNRTVPALMLLSEIRATEPKEPLLLDAWFPELQVMTARSRAGSRDGFYVAAKGGHNDESHNHNDVGNFIVYHDGQPVLIDAGAQTYTARTFSSARYDLWNNQSAYHNLPSINGVMQKEGRPFAARDVKYEPGAGRVRFALDIAGAYPEEAAVDSWVRSITLNRGNDVVVSDEYRLKRRIGPNTLNFLTPLAPEAAAPGRIRLAGTEGRSYTLVYDPKQYGHTFETVTIDDERMRSSWGDRVQRIVLTSNDTATRGKSEIRIKAE